MSVLEDIFKKLGLNQENGLHLYGEDLIDYPSRIKISLQSINYDAIYGINNSPMILFKKMDYSDDYENEIESFHKAVWNVGEIPILFIILPNEIRVYNGFVFDKEKNEIWKRIVNLDSQLNEFSFINLISGNLWEKYENKFNKETRVQDYLLKNLKYARKLLIEKNLPLNIIHNLIGRLIFSRYLIDRKVIKKDFFESEYKKTFEELILDKNDLYNYFKYLRNTFNGDMFPLVPNEKESVKKEHLIILYDLFKGNDIETGQSVLFDVYDFSIIPIELISNIYETFLDKRNINSNKSYYTPLFIVDFILNNTLDKILEDKSDSYCKILDPACGSGIFLVEALRRIIEKESVDKNRKLTIDELKRILQNNIFGIDRDEDAINISIFSIYLTLLDYYDLDEKSEFKFPEIKNRNLFVADFFDQENEFNNIMENVDLIVGNPPWGSFDGLHLDYIKQNNFPISNKQIAQSFLVRVKDFSSENTKVALIVTSKILYNLKANQFRKEFLDRFFIDKVLEFSAVRRNIFKNAIGPGAIIFYRYANYKPTENNMIEHISLKPNTFFKLFKAIVIEKYDMKYIKQALFKNYDWLWKVVLYGNVLDFYFIKRLKEKYKTIEQIIDESDSLKFGVGVQLGGEGKSIDISHLEGAPYLDLKKGALKRYSINYEVSAWHYKEAKRINHDLFEPPNILIKSSLDNNFNSVAAYSDKKILFRHFVGAIKGLKKDEKILKSLLGLINSQLSTYYLLATGSSTGIEREYAHNKERLSIPVTESILEDHELFMKVNKLQNQFKDTNASFENLNLENEINEHLFDLYNLDNVEKDIMNYAIEITIPLIKGLKKPFNNPSKHELEIYAQIFINHFKQIFNGPRYFVVEIHTTHYFTAMNFKIASKPQKEIKFIQDSDINKLIDKFGIISIEKINELYIQRDVKGFEENSFFVIKPNEYKNWHQAVARLDLSEFIEAMVQTNLKRTSDVQ